jgi:hypothetical protein
MSDQFPPNITGDPARQIAQDVEQGLADHPAAQAQMQSPRRRPAKLNPASLRARRQKREQGFEFTLVATTDDEGEPTIVRARRPEIFDADSMALLPDYMQQSIFQLISATEEAEGDVRDEIAGMPLSDIARNFGNVAHIADAYCVLGFIEPTCCATADEADAKGGVWVKDIEFADRMNFMNHCADMQKRAAADVASFPERPHGLVDAGSAGTALPDAGLPQPDALAPREV